MKRLLILPFLLSVPLLGSVLAGSLPKFDEKLEGPGQPPNICYEVPYIDNAIAEQYASLAKGSGGTFYSAIDQPLIDVIHRVLEDNLMAGTDIVFVIDHTSSMKDDIEEVREKLKSIIERLRATPGVRLGAVSFSDVKSGSEYGYRSLDLSGDYALMGDFLDRIELVGSVEDIYGAVWRTVDEFGWESRTRRMVVVIGDEKPATGRDTDFTEADVLLKCKSAGVATNIYPILIDKYE